MVNITEDFASFDLHLELIIQKSHSRSMFLQKRIPLTYPWEDFLKKHFSEPPFELYPEDFENIIIGKKKVYKIKDTRKPTSFYALFRYIEYFRKNLIILESNLSNLENKYDLLAKTSNESVAFRELVKRRELNYNTISMKREIFHEALRKKEYLDEVKDRLQSVLAHNLNISSKWRYMIEPFYTKVANYINEHFKDGGFNLMKFYPVKTMETILNPYYEDSMNLIIGLQAGIEKTNALLGKKKTHSA